MDRMNARRKIVRALAYDSLGGLATEQDITSAETLLDEYRAEVLAEAADFVGNDDDCDCGGCDTCIPNKLASGLRDMADPTKAARMQDAATTLAARRGPGEPPLKSRLALLLAHVREHGGDWTTRRVQKLYVAEVQRAPLRVTARKDLHDLHAMGWLVVDTTDPGRRVYRLNHAHGGTR